MESFAQKYFDGLISSFDFPTYLSPDVKNKEVKYDLTSVQYDVKIKKLEMKYDLSKNDLFLSIFLFNLVKFSFSKDILVGYNKQAVGYHFNTDLSIEDYIHDFISQFKDFPEYDGLDFEGEILFATGDYDKNDYKFIFSYGDDEIAVEYDSSYYSEELINAFLNAFNVLIAKINEAPEELLKNVSIVENLDFDENFEVQLANEGLINKIFENAVSENPDKVILYAEDGEFTYSQLNKKANRIANALLKRGLEVEDRVMIMMRRNSDLIASALGIVKAGGAFIPIDPNYPKHRINQMLEDSDSQFVITNKDIMFEGGNGIHVSELLEEVDDTNPTVELSPDNLCFLIYTSGSTGKPKGVMITHEGISNYIANHPENVPIYELNRKCSKFVSISMISFIVFLREIFGTILNGLPVVFTNDEQLVNPLEFYKLFKKHDADAFGATPTRLIEYLNIKEIQELVNECKIIIVGGEGFPPILYDRLREFSDADIYNSYGPTEVTIASHYKLIDSNEITAGWKMLNVVDKIMDIDANQLPPYVPGELYVGGAGIARGYINNPEQTEKVFMTLNGIPYYNTGDLCKKDGQGELYVMGRNDGQIKLRGLRIELSEIETLIARLDNVLIAKVLINNINNTDFLCAYFTATEKINIEYLKQYLSDNLPAYMVPSFFIQMDEFPKTPNGKTDFKNLPVPEVSSEHVDAESELEESILEICSGIVDFDDFGVTDNLYGVGFTSLTIMSLATEIYNRIGGEINVTAILQNPTVRNIAENIEGYGDDADEVDVSGLKYYELTPNQLGVYFDCVKDFEKVNYNLPKYIDFGDDIDENRLKSAIIKVINHHPYLKTRIVMQNGIPYQERRDDLIIDDLIEIAEVDSVDDKFKKDFIKPFDLTEGPLFRFKIIKTKGNVSLLCDFHHVIVDGMSLNILFRQIASVYDDSDLEFDENDLELLNGFEYSQKEVNVKNSKQYKESEMFFFNKIKEHDEGSLISPDLNGIEEEGHACEESKRVDKEMIDRFCNDMSITPNNLFLSVSSFVLSKFVNSRNLLFATISNGRFSPDEQNTLAMMVKTLPLSLKLDGDLSFKDYFDYVNGQWVDTLSHSSYPLTEIVNKYGIVPEFVFAFDGKIIEDIEINGKVVEREGLEFEDLKFKLSLDVTEINEKYVVACQYNDALYSHSLINTFLESIIIVLNKLVKFASQDLEHVLLKELSIIERDVPSIDELEFGDIGERRLNKIFENQVKSNGDKVILTASDGEFTFNDLNKKANRIANALIRKGVGIEDKIMFILKRTSNVPASILGILKAGAAFIPVDSEYPQERIEHVLSDSESKFIIVDEIVDIKGLDLSSCADKLLDIDELLKEEDISSPDVGVLPENLAYIIYTSGSTGLPKGVMIEHGNFANFINPHPNNTFCHELVSNAKKENYKLLSLVTVAFDTFLEEMLLPILNGVPVVLADDSQCKNPLELIPLIEKTGANVFDGTPSRLLQYLDINGLKELIANFKIFVVGGEAFPKYLYDILSEVSDAKIINSYGPTEITVVCNDKLIDRSDVVSVGGPLFNVYEEIMDMDANPLPPNVLGELYVAGKGVSRAYHNRPEKNAEAYVTVNGIRFYRTGDLAKWNDDGEVDILGRLDDQIKLRGLRIEIGEIESAIKEFEGIESLAVVVKKIMGGDHLCAYFTVYDEFKTDDEDYSIDIDALKSHLSSKLTYYMVPTVYMELDEMPLTLNGKTDLRNLPEPQLKFDVVMPETETEEKLYDIVSSLVDIEEFGVTDDLYALGFTSLSLMKLNSMIYEQIGGSLDISILFNEPTIKNFAIELDKSKDGESGLEEIIESAKGLQYYPLTENQLGIYYECVQNPDVIKYTMPTTVRFAGDVDANRLKDAIIKTIESHPYLKTRIVTHDGELKQKRSDDAAIEEIAIVKVDGIGDEEIAENDVGPISLENSQLFKFKIYETPDEVVLFSDFHHIITDGVSQNNLYRDIARIYENKDIDGESVDGYIYSILEKNLENSEGYQSAKEFFDDKLAHGIESTVLTPNLSGNPDEGKIKRVSDVIDSKLINEFCNDNSISKNALFMASAVLSLNKFTFTDKTLITTIFNGRSNPNYFNTQGFLVKTVPFLMDNENRLMSLGDFIKSVDQTWKSTLKNSIYPYTKIAEKYHLKPEFFFTYHEFLESDDIVVNDKVYETKMLSANDLVTTDSKISLAIYDEKDEFKFIMDYNDQLYTEDYVQKFLNAMKTILTQFVDNDADDCRICDVALELEKEARVFGDIDDLIIHERFEKQVDETPNDVALIASDETLTYVQLDQKANRIANALIKRGVKPKSRILIKLPRDSNLISSIFGVLKTGSAYIPIDLAYPQNRVDYIYENSQADYIISAESKGNVIGIDDLLKEEDAGRPNIKTSPEDLIYMIYTSGSTGKPKGVMISHKNVANLYAKVNENELYKNVSNLKKSLSITSVSFDPFMMDLSVLTFGLTMVLASDSAVKDIKELTELIKREKPDLLSSGTPSRINQFIEYSGFRDELNNFKEMYLGGEMMPEQFISKIKSLCDTTVYNSYGPTETTIICSFKDVTHSQDITIGKPSNRYVMDVRDIDGKLVPDGVMGELYIGGPCVGKGYYNLDDKTKEVFVTINDTPYYKSGDYSIKLPNGEFTIEGRIDNQIKLRGLRIEIGEIESNIVRFPHIKQCVVLIKEINDAEHLCAYFTSDEKIDINLLKRYLANKLTEYMVPTVFMPIAEMPMSPNGKTDIKRLPKPKLNLRYVEAEGETEEKLVELVASIINTTHFGTTDNLYEIGFTSLTLMKLNSMIFNETNVNIDITSLFTNPTIKSLADKIDNNIENEIDVDEIIEDAKGMEYFPLTSNQLGIYYECMQTEKIKYTMPFAIRFESSIDPYVLKDAVIKTVEAHPYLKTRIINTDDGKIMQKRCDDAEIEEIEIVEIDSISNEEIMGTDVRSIPLDNSQLFRFKIYKTPTETILFSDFHHIITDGVSQGIFFNDLVKAYNNEEIEAEKVDGFAYSLIEEETSISEVSEKFFKNQFSQGIESTVLTPNINGDPDIGNIKLISDQLSSDFVRHFCKDHSISPNVLFMAATLLSLNKFTFSGKSLITTIFNGRANSNYSYTQGMLVKTLPIIVNGENRDMMVEDYIKIVDKAWKDALTHSDYPYTKLAEDYQLKPEFFYAFHESLKSKIELNDRSYEAVDLDGTVTTDYKINMDVFDDGEHITLYLEYNDQIYTEEYVSNFLHSIKYILFQFFVNDMDKLKLNDIELVEGEIPEFEEIDTPILHKRFEKQAVEKADDMALVAGDSTLTYRQLNEKSNRIANALIKRGVKPKSNVLIMLNRESNLIASILGVLKAGCAFVPIDPAYPRERINYIYENSQADYIISGETSQNSLNVYELLEEENNDNPNVDVSPDDLAYMIYTSGSTGNPKGVMISHKNICNQAQNPKSTYESLLCITTISFDVSVDDILTSLSNGLKLILADDTQIRNVFELIKLIDENKPEVLEITPSRIASYLELNEFCNVISCLKCIFLGGEQFSAKVYEGLKKYTDAVVYNSYGPTETTITSNNKEVTDVNNLTVGPPLANYVTDVRDIDGKLVPNGVMGELYIGGMGVGKGYYNMPEKTEEVFLTINGIPYYRSGDYAIQLPNGEIDIKGRIDNQIKLRGLRIEIGEIESNIGKYPDIKQAVVVIKKINNNDHLCAYYTADGEIDNEDLKEFLKDRLTNYMIPTVFMQLDEMPHTPNGKTDIKKLPEPKLALNYVAPKTRLEQEICAIFSSILNIETVGAEDNFFEIGGTSLVASKLIIELLKQDYNVRYEDIFKNKTPKALAKLLSGEVDPEEELNVENDLIKKYDYGQINKLLEENTLENFFDGEKSPLGNVLLTGVTGFLGIHILYEFIKNEEGKIYCMLRKGKFDSCEERLTDLMNYYFDEDFSNLFGSRIILSEGDITEIDDFKKLEDEPIDTIINSAAVVKHYTADDYIFKVNVDGVINGLKFAQTRNNIKYVQISTVSVLSSYSLNEEAYPNQEYNERTLYYEQDLTNKYISSKFLAERMVLEAATKGLSVKIMRVGNLMSRYSDGLFQKNYDTNAFFNNLKAIKKLKAMNPAMAVEMVDMSQIDYVAKGIIALCKTPEESRVFHCMNDHYISHRDIVDALNTFGYGIKEVDFEEFKQIYEQNINENIQGIITADFTIDDLDKEYDFGENLEIEQTTEILHSLGFDWPEPDMEYLKRLIGYLNKFNYFE